MTIASSNSRNNYVAGGVSCSFAYTFKISNAANLSVYLCGVLITTGYSVSGAGDDSGGTVTFTTTPASGAGVALIRNEPYTQVLDLQEHGAVSLEAIEDTFDQGVMLIQQVKEITDRAVLFDVGSCTSGIRIDIPTPGYTLAWNSGGDRISSMANVCTGTLTVPAFTTGSIVIAGGATTLSQDTALFWDATCNKLGLGTNSPTTGFESTLECGIVTMLNGTPTGMHHYIHPTMKGGKDSRALGVEIASINEGAATGARVGLYSGAQTGGGTGGGTGNRIWAANFLVQVNAADTDAQAIGLELNVNNNKADSPNDLSGSVLKYGFSAVSDGSCKAAVAYGVSAGTNAQWRRGVRIDQGAIASGGFALEYRGDGTSGDVLIGADSCIRADRFITTDLTGTSAPQQNAVHGQSLARAWVVFDGTNANPIVPSCSFNIAGTGGTGANPIVTKTATGQYCVTFVRAFACNRYVVTGTAQQVSSQNVAICPRGDEMNTSCLRFETFVGSGGLIDSAYVSVTFYGIQA